MSDGDASWLEKRLEGWQRIERELPALEDKKPVAMETLQRLTRVYPELARDISLARREAPNSRTTAYMELVYRRLHRVIYSPPKGTLRDLQILLRQEVPQIAHGLRWQIFSIGVGFVLALFAGWWLVDTFPEMASLFASRGMIAGLEQGELWTDGLLNVMPSSVLSLEILTNNIAVALTAMSLGVLYGLGTIYIIGLNGLMIGGIFAVTAQYDMAGRLFDFVIAHGMVELSVIVLAGAIGFSLGEALARPGDLSRRQAFKGAAERGTKLMLVCVIFLFGAGIIEGYVSPDAYYNRGLRIAVGFAYWLVFLWCITGWDPQRRSRYDAVREA